MTLALLTTLLASELFFSLHCFDSREECDMADVSPSLSRPTWKMWHSLTEIEKNTKYNNVNELAEVFADEEVPKSSLRVSPKTLTAQSSRTVWPRKLFFSQFVVLISAPFIWLVIKTKVVQNVFRMTILLFCVLTYRPQFPLVFWVNEGGQSAAKCRAGDNGRTERTSGQYTAVVGVGTHSKHRR